MISKLPKWVWFGSAILAFIAGLINTTGFLGFQHQGVTHLTGSTTLLGIAAAKADTVGGLHLLLVIGSFFGGCVFGGFLVRDTALELGRRYSAALLIESALLFASVSLLRHSNIAGACLASCACGLQNGMVSAYTGAIIRTTHVSGIFTDLGLFLGQLLRGLPVDRRRIRLNLLLLGSFFGGAMAGAWAFARFDYATLYFPAALTGCVGLTCGICLQRNRGLERSFGK